MNVAVFGAGYAGLALARRLERELPDAVDLVVVDEHDYHLVQHEIHRAIRRPKLAEDLQIPLDEVLEHAEIRQARVTDVDPEAGEATLDGEETLSYDVGVVCLGAETAFYGLPGVEEHATPLKRLADAEQIRADFLATLEGEQAQVVVGGAGLSGIQVAGELAALAREEGASERVEVTLLEQERTVAPNFPAKFQRAVRNELESRGVRLRTGATVEACDDATITLEGGDTLPYDQFIWTGGIAGPDALDGERPVVRSQLRLAGDTFVVGDAARMVDADGSAVPASAQSAVRSAKVAADNVVRLVEHRLGERDAFEPRLENFQFDSPGWLVSIGDGAVAQVGTVVLTGPPAVAMKATVGGGYMTSVGAVRNAVDLVVEELGLSVDEADTSAQAERDDDGEEPIDVEL